MNSLEIQILFENKFRTLNKVGFNKFLNTNEMEYFLNESYHEYISALIKVFEINELARKALIKYTERMELEDVTEEALLNGAIGIHFSSRFYTKNDITLSKKVLAVVEEHVYAIPKNGRTTEPQQVQVKPVSHDYFLANIENKYKRPYKKLVWRLDISVDSNPTLSCEPFVLSDLHELVYLDLTIEKYIITFIKNYDDISIFENTVVNLPKSHIENIVNTAVLKAATALGLGSNKEPSN